MATTLPDYDTYRWVVPFTYILSFVIIILGPFLFPFLFIKISYIFLVIGVGRVIYMGLFALYRLYTCLTMPDLTSSTPLDLTHVWVIPTYGQDQKIICSTLDHLIVHRRAKKYIVMLAMQAHEANSKKKAENIIQKYKNKFGILNYTSHIIQNQNQAKHKASNISFCIQKLQSLYGDKYDFENKVYINIIDCDSWVPQQYINQMEAKITKNLQKSYKTVFYTTQVFLRNHLQVPVFTRTFDNYHSFAHLIVSVSLLEVGAPWGNYSLSYKLIKSVGFYDKTSDAIAEDIHNFSKIFWAKGQDAYSVPIMVPINSLNLSCSQNYFQNCKGKFLQAVRHGYAIYQCSYNIFEFSKLKVKTARATLFLIYFIETVLFHSAFSCFIVPYLAVRAMFVSWQTNILFIELSGYVHYALHITNIFNIFGLICFELIRRWSAKRFYSKQAKLDSWWRFFEYGVFLAVGMHAFALSFLLATFQGISKKISEHKVAGKIHNQDNKQDKIE